ncbi:hypothetical protein ACFL47_06835 [Candidatus Latescibacterota bacterium]
MKTKLLAFYVALTMTAYTGSLSAESTLIDIGSHKQLFIDFSLIESCKNIELTMNPPVKRGKVLPADKLWENYRMGSYGEVFEDDGLYRMWYESSYKQSDPAGSDPKTGSVTCYAESSDGLNWIKPVLGTHEFSGSSANNIVFDFVHHGAVFKDPSAPPSQRYKTAIYRYDHEMVYNDAAFSPDGLRDWTVVESRMNYLTDSQNMAFFDDQLGKYVFYFRGWTHNLMRTVVRFEADDFLAPWPVKKPTEQSLYKHDVRYPAISNEAPVVMKTDGRDPDPTDYYNPSVVKYPEAPDVYLAFPSMFFHFPDPPMGMELTEDDFIFSPGLKPPYTHIPRHYDAPATPEMQRRGVETRNSGFLDIRLLTSHDGKVWNRDFRSAYVSLGTEDEPDAASMYMFVGMIIRDGKIYQYYTGNRSWHGGRLEHDGEIMLLEQRLDGFVSADAAYEGGEMVTKPFVFDGTELHLNINTSAIGSAAVGILDGDGNVIEGYDITDCDVIRGNYIDRTVKWHDESDISALSGKTVRLRIMMRDSKLFSLRFK